MKNLKYLKYVIRHKWFVLLASRKIGGSFWRALVHDMSKFRPDEWGPYVQYFYGTSVEEQLALGAYNEPTAAELVKEFQKMVEPAFNLAWLKHQHRNPHHWQYWVLREDNPSKRYLIWDDGDFEGNTRIVDTSNGVQCHVPEMDLMKDSGRCDAMMRLLVRQANESAGLLVMRMPMSMF